MDNDFTPLTPEEDVVLDRLLEPLRLRYRELSPVNEALSLEELETYAIEPDQLEPNRRQLIEECCFYFSDTRYLVEAIQHPDPRLLRAAYAGANKGLAAHGEPPIDPSPKHALLIASISGDT